MLQPYLDDLEQRIEPTEEERLTAQWTQFAHGEFSGDLFSPTRQTSRPAAIQWPDININDAIDDFDLMALDQFRMCSQALANGSGELLNVRCNYGTGILPSVFGAELFIMPRDTNTLPTNRPLEGGIDAVKALLDRGVPDVAVGLGGKVFDMASRFQDIQQRYPRIGQFITLYHPDLQGPMDICELLWGSSLFLALLDAPDLVKQFLELITETYISFMRAWIRHVPFADGSAVHWSMMHQGHIMIRDDSAMNLSANMFKEFIEPYDQRLLNEFGGGAIHFCGKGDHYITRLSEMSGVYAINMSQPEYNNVERIFQHTAARHIKILGLAKDVAEQALQHGYNLRGNVHCW